MSTPPPDPFARSGSLRLLDHYALTPQGVLRGAELDYLPSGRPGEMFTVLQFRPETGWTFADWLQAHDTQELADATGLLDIADTGLPVLMGYLAHYVGAYDQESFAAMCPQLTLHWLLNDYPLLARPVQGVFSTCEFSLKLLASSRGPVARWAMIWRGDDLDVVEWLVKLTVESSPQEVACLAGLELAGLKDKTKALILGIIEDFFAAQARALASGHR